MVNNIFILNEQLRVVKVLTVNGNSTFFDDTFSQDFTTGAGSYEFSCNVNGVIEEGYYVMFYYQGEYRLFQIIDVEEKHDEGDIITTCYAESAILELLNGSFRGLTGDMSAPFLFQQILDGTRWQVGKCSDSLKTKVENVKIDKTTQIWSIIQDYMDVFNYEIDPRVEYKNGEVTGFYIDIYEEGELGHKTYKRFEYGRNVSGISKKRDLYDWCTAIIIDCDCEVDNITLSEKGYYKGKGSDTILAISENDKYNSGKEFIYGVYDGDETDGQEAVDNAYKELKKRAVPHFDYEVTTAMTYEEYMEVSLGDTVRVIDHGYNPSLLLEARIGQLELSFTDRNNCKCTLTNYKELKSNIREYNDLFDGTRKLTEADIIAIRKYLADLDIDKDEIERIIKALLGKTDDPVEVDPDPQPPKDDTDEEVVEDSENYKTIKLSTINGGLWLGDKRVYDTNKNKSYSESDTKAAKQYKDALEYYKKFSLGSKKSSTTLSTVMSENNKYKLGVMIRYWCKKFGLDTRLVDALIVAESSGNPYCATKSSAGGYGVMQCERAAYFNKKQTIKFVDGSTRSFTPSYSTMDPKKGKTVTVNGVKVNGNINNQIMFGCHELRQCAQACHYNVFATLMAYNFGQAGMQWCVCEYIKDKYGYSVNSNKRGIVYQSTKVKEKYYDILDSYKAPFASYRKKYKTKWNAGTPTNIEGYLRYYKPKNGQLPYFLDKKGKKLGYGVILPTKELIEERDDSADEVRDIIVGIAKKIVDQHVKQKIATYDQDHRTVNFDKPKKWPGTHYGIKNPICYDCSSLVSCAYLKAGLKSVYAKSCKGGSLVESATSKSGYKMWKCDSAGIKDAKPGDLVMGCNYKVTSKNCTRGNWTAYGRTHHVMVYIGNGKVAHARKWAYHPNAISISKLSDLDDYKNSKMFFLRPWDLAEADKKSVDTTTPIKTDTVSEVTIKGLPGATSGDYADLVNDLTIGGVRDNVKFPKTTKYVFCHFGVGDLDTDNYISLLRALQSKYPKKPIFVAKEYHVNSKYSNADTVNANIDDFNATMKNYCNKTKYVIFLDISKGLVDSNGAILTDLSTDGYSFKDADSVTKYYDNVKKYILNISKGQIIKSSSTSVSVTLLSQKIHEYSKPIKSLTVKLPKTAEDGYYTRLIFSTDSSSIKFTQPDTLYLAGDNCKKGAFVPKKANKYIVNIFKNADTELTNKKYYGNVTSMYTSKVVKQTGQVNTPGTTLNVRKGSSTKYAILGKLKDNTTVTLISKTSNNWYKIKYKSGYGYVSGQYIDNIKDATDTTTDFTNYKNFKYRDTLVKNAESFLAKKSNFVYDNKCAFDFKDPSANVDSWMTGAKYHLDDNFLMQMLVMGYNYDTASLKKQTSRVKAKDVSWALPYISSESKLARYFVENDWVLDDVDYTNFSNIEPGDILFWDSDDIDNNEFMACSHTSICVGKTNGVNYMIEGNNGTDEPIRKVKISDRSVNNLLFVGRINLSK